MSEGQVTARRVQAPPQAPLPLTGKAGAGRVCPGLAHSPLDAAPGPVCRELSWTVFCQFFVINRLEKGPRSFELPREMFWGK